jgi:hypothetical protein
MRSLTIGMHDHEVMFLQRMLNKRGAMPYVTEDGIFGARTQEALVAFQRTAGVMPANGIAGPGTWQHLGPITERMHRIVGYNQPDDNTCWSAAATMMLGGNMSVGPGAATLLRDMASRHQLEASLSNVEAFVRGLGWHMVNNTTSPPASQVIQAVLRGSAWVAFQGLRFGHVVVFSGVLTDGGPDGTGTVFRVHDPWPPHSRRVTVYGTTHLGGTVWLRSVSPPQAAMIAYIAQP